MPSLFPSSLCTSGHQPLLPAPLGHGPPIIPHSQHPHILTNIHPLTHNNLVGEGIREVDLPGLSADEIETILSENSNWSGEQFKNFFHSAVELSEIEAKLFSGSGYESDSGYSTYDVSPITSSAPLQFGGCRPAVSTSYRSISPALTPVNPSPYISLSSSNPFQFGHTSMHMSLHASGPATTPLPHSASPDAEFSFFPPTPTYHPPPSAITPTQEVYMVPHGAFPMQTTTQYPRDFQLSPYPAVLPEMRPSQQQEAYGIEFPNILGSNATSKDCMSGQYGEIQRRRVPVLPQNPNKMKIEIEHKPCPNTVSNTTSSSPTLAPITPTPSLPPIPAAVKLEVMSEESPCNSNTSACKKMSQPPPSTTHPQSAVTSQDSPVSISTSTQLKSFLATCSKVSSLQELVSSGVHPSVVVVTVSTALSALTNQAKGTEGEIREHQLSVQKGPYDISQLHSLIMSLTPHQSEKLADPELISAAKLVATEHLESLAAARRKGSGKQPQSTASAIPSASPSKQAQKTAPQLAGAIDKSKTPLKASITVKAFSKTSQQQLKSSTVGRVGAGSHMKNSHKKKTQWPRSMSKANLMAFREHILNKLKRGQEESQRPNSLANSPGNPSGVPSSFEMDISCDRDLPIPVRCSSEPADFFSRQMHTDSPSPLQTSHSAGDISSRSLHFHSDSDNKHPDFNPDILLSSSMVGLPDTLLTDMELDNLGSISSPSEHDLAQFLCDPSPPSSVTSPIDSMEDLQDFLSGSPESSISPTHLKEDSSPASSVHNASLSPTTTTATQQSTSQAGQSTTCSMADVASLFNESINSIANVESMPEETAVVLEDSLESVFQRPTDPLLACGSRLHW